jgi:sugar lactone lactonase YvrE
MRRLIALAAVLVASSAGAHPPAVEPPTVFASAVDGPEGLAFTRQGLVVGSETGQLRRYAADGTFTVLAEIGERLAGVSSTADDRVLACAFDTGNVWSVLPDGTASILASGITGPNFALATRTGRIFVSSSPTGTIQEITTGTPVERASGLTYPNGMAIGPDRRLYVAETFANRVSRLAFLVEGGFGLPETFSTAMLLPDGIAFDRKGNLLITGGDALRVVFPDGTGQVLTADPLLFWPANLAFGRGQGFRRRDVYLSNYGLPLGDGTEVLRVRYNHGGARVNR